MSSKHTVNKFFDKLPNRITLRLPDDVKEELFEFAKKNDLLDAEYVKDIVLPFIRSKNGHSEEKSWRETNPRNKEESINIECPALIDVPTKGYHCANKAPKITPIPSLLVCKFCWERQQKQKVAPTKPTPLKMYKKPEKIYCIEVTLWIDPLKNQGRCEKCKLTSLRTWAKCQTKNMQRQREPT